MPKFRALPVLSSLTAASLALSGRRLRERASLLPVLNSLPAAADPVGTVDTTGWRVVSATGVELHPDTLAAAVAWAQEQGLDAVDLVPVDLTVARALDLLRLVDPASYRSTATAQGRTAGHAVVVRAELAERAELPTGPVPPPAMVEVARQVKRYAPRTCDLVVAPRERAVDLTPDEELAVQRAVFDRYGTANLAALGLQLAVLGSGLLASRPTGLAALAAYEAQPAAVFAGQRGPLAPRDLTRTAGTRWARETGRLTALLRAEAPRPTSLVQSDALRPEYAAEIALGTERFLEPRVDKCRWCGSTELSTLLTTPDLIQNKPGTFSLDECGSCGHVFQNPRLSPEGLDFYYKDCYDGFGGEEMERIFATQSTDYEGRAAMVREHDPAPARWLDVGSGHAHFCLVARELFPDTSFEGLDLGAAIDDAAHRGWIDRSFRGMFPDVAPELAGQFDVVSMHHYLEHTREPAEELDAAVTALKPGGLLMIEVPNPDCAHGRALGRYWMPWLQPQHQHFVSMDRLQEALEERGFTVLERETTQPTRGLDTVAAAWLLAGHLAPRLWMPWHRRPTHADRAARLAAVTTALGAGVVAAIGTEVAGAISGDVTGSAFRMLARLDGPERPVRTA
ncbi:class I SAM-dependent methyltransferase [Nocardioides jishulii]|uniref:Class I SAM-dependent methyltransferase n=1 Tax=Nocardioides jishulii TaxID=2575440 RepID=A0A4U2YI13_9ACTN|nr:class I SAM-dependent methyltransferase [Nocardioides jishulii]QCX28063.1 class I SAM-dependent methyltransferase [Nocardioides jishulii]TKI60727.1 class I SAM-dependent methyltransferase [Nocardioides jishulii]